MVDEVRAKREGKQTQECPLVKGIDESRHFDGDDVP